MDENRLDVLLAPYNPWWTTTGWDSILPAYRRPIVSEVLADLKELPQIISVTGPRRVGKTTALRHIISHLIYVERMNPKDIVYLSLDDPEVYLSENAQRVVLDLLFDRFDRPDRISWIFLDEMQRLVLLLGDMQSRACHSEKLSAPWDTEPRTFSYPSQRRTASQISRGLPRVFEHIVPTVFGAGSSIIAFPAWGHISVGLISPCLRVKFGRHFRAGCRTESSHEEN